jgi:hypothetical protein
VVFTALAVAHQSASHQPARLAPTAPARPSSSGTPTSPLHTAPAAILIVGWFALWRRVRPARV